MNKKLTYSAIVVVVIAIAAWVFVAVNNQNQPATQNPTPQPTQNPPQSNPLNTTYTVDGQSVTLVDGKASSPAAPGSATQITTTIFGQPVSGDLNGDGKADAAVILVQDPGGTGTFYYVAAAISGPNGAQGTNAILLGDRISPQTIEIKNGQIIANYADRKPSDPMSAAPSVGVSKYINFNGTMLVEAPAVVGLGGHCGGNMTTAPICAAGYHCVPEPGSHLPFGDVGGICVGK